MSATRIVCAVALLLPLSYRPPAAAWAAESWPQFRGPAARGVLDSQRLPDRWSATENVAWKRDIPGRGWSSPIVWGHRLFLTTAVSLGEAEAPRKGLYFGGERPEPPQAVHQWKVLCLDLETGQLLWERLVHEGRPETPIHLKSSYASETPVTDGQRLYCYFGNLGLFCLDLDGQPIWQKKVRPRAMRYGWGTGASPVLHQGRIYLVNDNDEDSHLRALDCATGDELWRVPRDEQSNWSTPFVWEHPLRTEIVTTGSDAVRSYDLEGRLLWSLSGMSSITIATPYADGGLLYISSGYILDAHKPIYAIRPGASGDLSLTGQQTSNEFIAWSLPRAAPYNPTSLVYRSRLHVLYDRGLIACFDAVHGGEIYSAKRLQNGRAFTASPWACDGKLFCLNEDGVTFVLQAGDEFQLLHKNVLEQDDMCMATPAMTTDRLLIRTAARIYCLQAAAASPADN